MESKFELRFKMETGWNDDRLLFISLNEDDRKNKINNLTDIWIPEIGTGVINPIEDNLRESNVIITTTKTEDGILTGSND